MLKEHHAIFSRLLFIGDLVIVLVSFFAGYYLRNSVGFLLEPEDIKKIYPLRDYLNLIPYLLATWTLCLFASGAYKPLRARHMLTVLFSITQAAVFATLLFGSLAYLLKLHYLSRLLITLISIIAWSAFVIERIIILTTIRHLQRKGFNAKYLLIVGTGPRARDFMRMLQEHPEWGLKISGILDKDPALVGQRIEGHPVIGTLADVPNLLQSMVVDEVIFIVPRRWLGDIEEAILYCEQLGKRVSIAVDLFNMRFAKAVQRGIHRFPLLTFETTSDRLWQLMVKRTLDFILSFAAIVILSPLLIFSALLIRLTAGGPVIFKQVRCGLNGRLFTVYKFRTMVVDAEKKLEQLAKHNEVEGPAFKMSNDPRIIKPGKWMRKFSIDELPQLVNVLQGDMSFVGPRPPIPAEVKKYEPWQRRRLSMRPGLTCLWQVQGRSKIVKFDEWMKLDLQYIDNWSLWLDLKLFFKTIPIVLFGVGAK